ncbi:8-oxoguanine deaminase [Thiosulfativibrio zosterae]|uniref:8-oxoguanine deaminase n=1 Tax=Thiosulfativibrio zosterae TaxID=2675053 RepID=A0A6F8PPE6_9GAMM|nr:8-oxoguanine deaminase [Thiosulfativibrio zosterae]BBP43908.1 8-oxoguanine deaminase [Thiosulfativibrio zosterae]
MSSSQPLWIQNPLAIFTGNDQDARGGLVVLGSEIIELVAQGAIPKTPNYQVFDASEQVILPGLINVHHHFYQTLTRAYPPALNKRLFPWLKTLYPVWANLQQAQLEIASTLAMAELMLSGCTTASDHHYVFTDGLENAIDIQIAAAQKLGMRVHLTRGSMSLGVEQGGLPPQNTVQTEQVILDDSERLIKTYHQRQDGAMTRIALAPCSPFSVTEDLMVQSAAMAEQFDVRLHTHLAETEDENAFCLKMFGLRPLDYLQKVNWLSNRVWLAHGIHFNDAEVLRLGQAGVGISHCPSSNMVLASGICRGLELEASGCPVGIGVDGSASNDGSNMINEVRQALLIGRLRYQADEITHLDVLRWATQGSAGCLGRSDIGEIAVGKQADLALFKLDELRFSGAGDPLAALIMCGAQAVDRLMVAGQWRVVDGQLLGLDISALMANHSKSARSLIS